MSATLTSLRRLPIAVVSALVLALAFTSVASALPGKRSVDANDLQSNVVKSTSIVNGAVKTQDLGAGAVISQTVKDESLTGADILNGSLTGDDVKDESLTGAKVLNDSLTGDDVKESTLQGVASSSIRTIVGAGNVPAGTTGQATAACAATERAIGASAAYTIPNFQDGNQVSQLAGLFITGVQPNPATGGQNVQSYTAYARNESGTARTIQVYVTCQSKTIS